jgi:2-keto-myo-inositol isomerase
LISVSLNQIAAPFADASAFCALASQVKCAGIELRTDIKSVAWTIDDAKKIGALTKDHNLRIFTLSEVGAFDDFDEGRLEQTKHLIALAISLGAEAVSFIPRNDNHFADQAARRENLSKILTRVQPLLEDAGLIGLIEPLGFKTASIRRKVDVVDAIVELGFEQNFKLIHDTFHHALVEDEPIIAQHTGLVHISGVEDASLDIADMKDQDRVLVGPKDRLGNIEQIKQLRADGYVGPISFEPFSPMVQNSTDLKAELERSIQFIESQTALFAA